VGTPRLTIAPSKPTSWPSRVMRKRFERSTSDGSCHFGSRTVLRPVLVMVTSTLSAPTDITLTRSGLNDLIGGAAVATVSAPTAIAVSARPVPRV
jgi:hypothetical protein